jgi:hypothetical protein
MPAENALVVFRQLVRGGFKLWTLEGFTRPLLQQALARRMKLVVVFERTEELSLETCGGIGHGEL